MDAYRAQRPEWYESYRESYRETAKAHARKRRTGCSAEEFAERLEQQRGLCAICGDDGGERGLVADHCHQTEVVRGLLCNACNLGIGSLKDDPEILESAVTYLRATTRP